MLVIVAFLLGYPKTIVSTFNEKSYNDYLPIVYSNYDFASIDNVTIEEIYKQLKIKNVIYYGAIPNDNLDDTQYILAAINSVPSEEGGIIFFPSGEYIITETIVIEKNGITLQGAGIGRLGYLWGSTVETEGGTILKWEGAENGTLLKIGNSIIPNAGCGVNNIILDGNSKAKHLLVADASYYLSVNNIAGHSWKNGYGIVIKHSSNVPGAGEKYYTWENITLVNPYKNAGGIDIAPEGSGNVNQINITGCNITRHNSINNYSSLRLGYADHISFYRCTFNPSLSTTDFYNNNYVYERINNYAITIQPISGYEIFPMNISFFGTSIYGGINYVNSNLWIDTGYHALLFYPFYSADFQLVPPQGYVNGNLSTLPLNLVGGFTDTGEKIEP